MARYNLRELEPRVDALDLALLSYILREAAPFFGRTKLQKTTFLCELRLRDRGLTGPSFKFFRYTNGPFSRDLWNAFDVLSARGFAFRAEPKLTRRGLELAELVDELKKLPTNGEPFKTLDSVLRYCKKRNGRELLEEIYETEVTSESWSRKRKIADIPMGTNILTPKSDPRSIKVPSDLGELILEELQITEQQILEAAEKELPSLEEQFIERVVNGDRRVS